MPFVEWLGTWPGAVLLQRSGTAYLFVNAAHIASIGLLIGGILPLDLRLAGLLARRAAGGDRSVPVAQRRHRRLRWRSRPGSGCSP